MHTALGVVLFFATPCFGQDPSSWTIEGRVVDWESGQPIQAAQVFVESEQVGRLTNREGEFSLTLSAAGPVLLQASRIGYCSWERLAEPSDATDNLQIPLPPMPLVLDGPPTFSVPEWPYALISPMSPASVVCALELDLAFSDRAVRLTEPVAWPFPLLGPAEAALRHPDVVALGQAVRGARPLTVAINDSSLEGVVVPDAPLPHRFTSGPSGLSQLGRNEIAVLALLSLTGVAPDTLRLFVHFESRVEPFADQLQEVSVAVVRSDGRWAPAAN